MLFVITLIYLLFIFTDAVPLIKGKQWKMLAVFSVVLAVSYLLFVFNMSGVLKPNMNTWFMEMIHMVFGDIRGSIVHE